MKQLGYLLLFFTAIVHAQVGIGTTSPSSSAILQLESTNKAFVPPRMTDTQMLGIPSPLNGSMIYNNTYNAMFVKTPSGWKNFFETSNATLVLNKVFPAGNTLVSTVNNTYYNFPVGATETVAITPAIFTVLSNGKIRVSEAGIYMLTGSFSVTNMPSGTRKFIIGAYVNNALVGYLSRGTANLDAIDEWGTSGSISVSVAANDVVEFKYVLNNGGTSLEAKIFNIGIAKLK